MEFLENALAQGLAPGIVVAIYLIIVRIIDAKKDNNQIKVSKELTQSITTISQYIATMTKTIVDKDKEKCKIAIDDSLSSAVLRLIKFAQMTIIQNHLKVNKNNILENIHNIVNSEYYTIFSNLNLYQINGVNISEYLDKNWIKDIETDLSEIIFNGSMSNEEKIFALTNKLTLKFDAYITYVTNKALK